MAISPILKIRLKKLTRHPCKSLFKYFYSTLFLGAFTIIYLILTRGYRTPSSVKINESLSLNVEDLVKRDFLKNSKGLCILSQEETEIAKDFSNFIQKNFKNKSIFLEHFNQTKTICQDRLVVKMIEKEDKINITIQKNSKNRKLEVLSNILQLDNNTYKIKALIGSFLKEKFLDKGNKAPDVLLSTENLSKPPILGEAFISIELGVVITLSNISLFFSFALWIVSEKEGKLEDFLRRQGVTPYQYSLSWLITYIAVTTIPVFINATFVFVLKNVGFGGWLFLVIIQLLSNLSLIGLVSLLGAIINKTQTAQAVLKLFYIGLCIVAYLALKDNPEKLIYILFFPQVNEIVSLYLFFEVSFTKRHPNFFYYFYYKDRYIKNISNNSCFMFLICTFILYFGLSLIISNLKFKYVIRKIQKSNEELSVEGNKFQTHHEPPTEKNIQSKENNNYLLINGVYKYFGSLAAVKGFTGELYPDEIFCLLGHNGAGKTTLISIISGQENPNEGNILLDGTDIIINKDFLLRNIGVCTQEDIFFEYLTVKEHLEYMSLLKGVQIDNTEITDLINKIGLYTKEDAICSTLSGGEKRKLCICLALIGNSKLILLDEPTSGMDVFAKKDLWQFLKEYKRNKIIVLTTHSLDEAECLGDKIGIMSEGEYVCSGPQVHI